MTLPLLSFQRASAIGAVVLATFLFVPAAQGQSDSTRMPSFYVGGGVSQYDLSGTGTAPAFAARAAWDWRRNFVLEAGASITRTNLSDGLPMLVIPDAQIQAQARIGNWRPYVGVGAGVAIGTSSGVAGGWSTEPVASASGGVRVWFRRWLAARAELRVHGIGTGFEGATAEWTGGLQWRLK
jgi:hypothetical protein